ncbi:LexA family protein [Pseudomonas sp. NPDC089743]|uniref:LexA family protein n=1 Tax=Pseudomonas sp. NPDC089743 TaxID=3364471 RepID=UPI003828A2B4
MKKRALTPEQADECAKLKETFLGRKNRGVTQAAIAAELEISQAGVSHYLNGYNPLNSRAAAVFAKMLEVPVSQFSPRLAKEIAYTTEAARIGEAASAEETNVKLTAQPSMSYRYPVISWVAAGDWAEAVEPFPPGFSDRYEVSDYEAKGVAFWLEVKGDSMTAPSGTSITEGMMILVDTEADAHSGKLVVAKLTDSNEATFKKLIEDAGRRFLKPLNPAYPMLQVNGNCKIIGVVVRAMMKL